MGLEMVDVQPASRRRLSPRPDILYFVASRMGRALGRWSDSLDERRSKECIMHFGVPWLAESLISDHGSMPGWAWLACSIGPFDTTRFEAYRGMVSVERLD